MLNQFKRVVILAAVYVCVLFLSACDNTIQGFGKDMQKTGENIQKSVNG